MNITQTLAQFLTEVKYEKVPLEVVERTKDLFLDFIALAARGTLIESTQVLLNFIKGMKIAGKALVIGTNYTTAPQYAALVNGASAHSLELDDIHNESSLHPAVVIFPAALAASQIVPADGRSFITAVVCGYETMIRLGMALKPAEHYARGFHPTATCGVFGAAVTVAKVLGLNVHEMINALGIAGSQASGSHEYHADGAWTKRFHPGWAAHNGLLAALLAREGFKGPQRIIEGGSGFLNAYSGNPDPEQILTDLGESYQIMRVSFKPHACCRYKQGPIDGVLELVNKHDIMPEQVAEVTIGLFRTALPIIAEPTMNKSNPRTVVDAQFSMAFGAAVAILKRRASLEEYNQQYVDNPQVQQLMQKVQCVHRPELDPLYPRQWPSVVSIRLKDGRFFETRIDYPRGDPENPLSSEELRQKFNGLTLAIWSESRREKIAGGVRCLEEIPTMEFLENILQQEQ